MTLQDARHFGWNVPDNISLSWYVFFLCGYIINTFIFKIFIMLIKSIAIKLLLSVMLK